VFSKADVKTNLYSISHMYYCLSIDRNPLFLLFLGVALLCFVTCFAWAVHVTLVYLSS